MHDSPGWAKASLEFKDSLLGFATDWLILNMDEVLRGLLCSGLRIRPNHPGGIANI